MIISIASGKGGTGKTTVSTNLDQKGFIFCGFGSGPMQDCGRAAGHVMPGDRDRETGRFRHTGDRTHALRPA